MIPEILGDRYKVDNLIGHGRMVNVFRGLDLRTDRVIAIKVLQMVWNDHPSLVARFKHSVEVSSEWQHPNIIQVFDYGNGKDDYLHYLIIELVEGTDLLHYLYTHGRLDVDRAIIIAHGVALGLGASHLHGIVHRGVMPQNILLCSDDSAKIAANSLGRVSHVQYTPPERFRGEIITPDADVYALGVVIYHMVAYRDDTHSGSKMPTIPDPLVPPSQLNPNIPTAFEEIILRCLEKEPEKRFQDGSQVADALETLI